MIFYILAGLVLSFGVIRMYTAILGDRKNQERLGAYINLFVYAIAVFLPFNYIIGVVLFGLGVLYLLSLSFVASFYRRALTTAATFIVLVVARIGAGLISQDANGLVLYVLAALAVFAVSSAALDISLAVEKNKHKTLLLAFQKEAEEEKNELISQNLQEINSLKYDMAAHLKNTLNLLDRYKVEDAEASIRELIRRNELQDTE